MPKNRIHTLADKRYSYSATDEADSAWARLTAYERKNRRIQVFETTDFDPYGGDGYDQPDGAFDSDNL